MVVENSLGLLKDRFRRLLHFSEHIQINLVVNITVGACVLHNMCIQQNDIWGWDIPTNSEENTGAENVRQPSNNATDRRQTLIDELILKNIL